MATLHLLLTARIAGSCYGLKASALGHTAYTTAEYGSDIGFSLYRVADRWLEDKISEAFYPRLWNQGITVLSVEFQEQGPWFARQRQYTAKFACKSASGGFIRFLDESDLI